MVCNFGRGREGCWVEGLKGVGVWGDFFSLMVDGGFGSSGKEVGIFIWGKIGSW